jgi:hypothetical protein
MTVSTTTFVAISGVGRVQADNSRIAIRVIPMRFINIYLLVVFTGS